MADTHLSGLVVSEGLKYGDAASSVTVFGQVLEGSVAWTTGSILDGLEEAKEVTVTGAALGDFCMVSINLDVKDLVLDGQVTAADTVTAVLANNTGGTVTSLGAGTLYARVFSRT